MAKGPTTDGARVRADILRAITGEWETAAEICYRAYSRCVQDGSEVSVGRYLRLLADEGELEMCWKENSRKARTRHFRKKLAPNLHNEGEASDG